MLQGFYCEVWFSNVNYYRNLYKEQCISMVLNTIIATKQSSNLASTPSCFVYDLFFETVS